VVYQALADVVVIVHLAFVAFALLGGLLVLRWRWLAWLHLPAAAWATLVEIAGWICPLTPLENRWRHAAGDEVYAAGFVEHYVVPVLYPGHLTRTAQIAIGALVAAVNVGVYLRLSRSRR
jgi:hypothetical protein